MSAVPARRPTPSPWPAAALVGCLSAVLGLVGIGRKSLWYDEAFNAIHVHQSWTTLAHLIRATEMSQAAYLVLLKPWAGLTPATETWLRLPSVAAAAVAAALVVPVGTRLFDRTTGVVAGLLLATNALLVAWSQQARTYALVAAAVVVVTLLLLRALDDPSRANWLLYGAAAAGAVYCHFWAGFVVAAQVVSLAFAPAAPPRRRLLEAAGVFLALAAVALFFTATAGRNQLLWIDDPSATVVRHVVGAALGHNTLVEIGVVAGLAVLAVRAVGARARRSAAAFALVLVGGWLVLPILLALLVSVVQPILVTRYAIVLTPAVALASAVAVAELRRVGRFGAVAAAVALVATLGLSARAIADWYGATLEDWRGAVALVDHERHPGDSVLVAPYWAIDAMRYYAPALQVVSHPSASGRTLILLRAHTGEEERQVIAAIPGVTAVTVTGDRRFGTRLAVVTTEPRR